MYGELKTWNNPSPRWDFNPRPSVDPTLIVLHTYMLQEGIFKDKNGALPQKWQVSYIPLPPHNDYFSSMAAFFCPQGSHCREV